MYTFYDNFGLKRVLDGKEKQAALPFPAYDINLLIKFIIFNFSNPEPPKVAPPRAKSESCPEILRIVNFRMELNEWTSHAFVQGYGFNRICL